MPAFFSQNRGTVSLVKGQVNGNGLLPFNITLRGMDLGAGNNPQSNAIITQMSATEEGNYQFMHTTQSTIYGYVFGDRIGDWSVSGICFASSCYNKDTTGMQQIFETYRKYRIANSGTSVLVDVGSTTVVAFLTGMSLSVADPERNLGQWAFRFKTIPRAFE